jgi:hypothetical protein
MAFAHEDATPADTDAVNLARFLLDDDLDDARTTHLNPLLAREF